MMMDQAHFGEYLLRQQMLHAASLSGLHHRIGADAKPPACEARLLNGDLWRRFHDIGTEMIITKGGRARGAAPAPQSVLASIPFVLPRVVCRLRDAWVILGLALGRGAMGKSEREARGRRPPAVPPAARRAPRPASKH
ncbi:unnamed protein product [Euphydryas editha]|uniref:T-box domain-containing protein n=1 Tax=Euphydryas editha TaxID=104508 RepID=A0AAU9TNF0_EUPED|nr:unnamed protein product [Euphydryas editha]